MTELELKGSLAKKASRGLNSISTEIKNNALKKIAQALVENAGYILSENEKDLKRAEENGMSKAMLDRLSLRHG